MATSQIGIQPIFDGDEPGGKGRTVRAVNKLVREWLVESQERPLRFLTAGQDSIGPVLIRGLGLLGSNDGTEFPSMAPQEEEKEPAGNTPPIVTVYKWKKHDIVDVTMFDTPGLHDDSIDETAAVAQMVRKIGSHIDVFLFCCKLEPSSRVSKVEERMVSRLTRAFGESLWQKAVLVFRFAGYEEMVKIDHKKLIAVHEDGLRGCIRRADVPQNVIMEIPLCVAGNPDHLLKEVLRRAAPNAIPSLLMLKWRPDAAVRALLLSVGGSMPSSKARSSASIVLSTELKTITREKYQAWKEACVPVLEQKHKHSIKSSSCVVC